MRVAVFEKSLATGGLWNYDSEARDSSHSSIYEGLKTNLPKEIMGFPGTPNIKSFHFLSVILIALLISDFPFAPSDHSFLGHQEVAEYLNSYAKQFDLNQVWSLTIFLEEIVLSSE